MGFTRLKGIFKTGKLDLLQIVKSYLLEEREKEEIKHLLQKLSIKEKKELIAEVWDEISPDMQKILSKIACSKHWEELLAEYEDLKEKEQLRTLELLGYFPNIKIADFLLQQMKNKKESIRLTATASYKMMGPDLTMEPMLQMLSSPEEILPSRVFEVLCEMQEEIIPLLLQKVENIDIQAQLTIIQILGELGGKECLPVFEKMLDANEPLIRQRIAEALKIMNLKESVPILFKLVEDKQWQTRMQAVETLGSLKIKETKGFFEMRKTKEKHPVVAECLEEALMALKDADVMITINWVREGM